MVLMLKRFFTRTSNSSRARREVMGGNEFGQKPRLQVPITDPIPILELVERAREPIPNFVAYAIKFGSPCSLRLPLDAPDQPDRERDQQDQQIGRAHV